MSVTIYAPASIGNISVGFDLLGAAISPIDDQLLGDKVSIEASSEGIVFALTGRFADKLPKNNQDNIVYQCVDFFVSHLGVKPAIKVTLEKNLPIGSGLGSSASSVVAALTALNKYFEKPFDDVELLKLMGEFEGRISGSIHYDNVAPCFLGGMQLMTGTQTSLSEAIPNFKHWYWVVAYSGVSLSTSAMRQLLPNEFSKEITLDFARNLAVFIHACYKQDEKLALSVLKDVLAEPYRAPEIPKFIEAKQALEELGMLATGISGSGPTLFSVTDSLEKAQQAKAQLEAVYIDKNLGFTHICKIDNKGARTMN